MRGISPTHLEYVIHKYSFNNIISEGDLYTLENQYVLNGGMINNTMRGAWQSKDGNIQAIVIEDIDDKVSAKLIDTKEEIKSLELFGDNVNIMSKHFSNDSFMLLQGIYGAKQIMCFYNKNGDLLFHYNVGNLNRIISFFEFDSESICLLQEDERGEDFFGYEYDQETDALKIPVSKIIINYVTGEVQKSNAGYFYQSDQSELEFEKKGDKWYSATCRGLYEFDGDQLLKMIPLHKEEMQFLPVDFIIDGDTIQLLYVKGIKDDWSTFKKESMVNCMVDTISLINKRIILQKELFQYYYENLMAAPSVCDLYKNENGYVIQYITNEQLDDKFFRQDNNILFMDKCWNLERIIPISRDFIQNKYVANNEKNGFVSLAARDSNGITVPILETHSIHEYDTLKYPIHITSNKPEYLSMCGEYNLLAGGSVEVALLTDNFETCIAAVNGQKVSLCENVVKVDSITQETSITIKFVDHEYEESITVDKEATCTEAGYKSRHCKKCDAKTDVTEIAALGHVLVWDNAIPATCTENGKIEGSHCTRCGEVLVKQEVIKATGHKWDNGTVTKEATATEDGVKTFKCINSGCNETKTEVIPKTGEKPGQMTDSQPKIGDTVTDQKTDITYTITENAEENKTVAYTQASDDAKGTVKVPATVTINDTTYKVTKIEDKAFAGNKKITKVTIGSNITEIGASAFSGCSKLKSVTVGSKVTKIGSNAFKGCTSLTKVTLPAKTNSIGANAFNGCKKIKTITIKSTKLTDKSISKNAFKGLQKGTTIKVPKKKLSAYKKLFKKKGLSSKVKVTA